jgi:hypothetical protein
MSTSQELDAGASQQQRLVRDGQPHGECAPAGAQQQVPGYQQRRNDHDDQVSVRGRPGDADICPERAEPGPLARVRARCGG